MAFNLRFLSNNVNGLRSSKKRVKVFEYFKGQIVNNGIIFLQETHSSEDTFNEWRNDFKGEVFFSHGTTSSCGVMIGYLGNEKFSVNKICKNNNSRVLMIEVEIETETFILLNLYNSKSETEQLQTLSDVDLLLSDFSLDDTKTIVFAGDFNLFFNQKIEATGRNSVLKKKSISKVLQITKKYDLIDIWRVRSPSSTRFTFRKNRFSGFIQRRLDYIFISNSIQEFVQNIDVLPSFCNDHSSLLLSYKKLPHSNFWKYNCSLTQDELYVLKMKKHIENIINSFVSDFNHQMKWEFLKHEIRKFTTSFSKNKAKSMREKKLNFEKKN